jgi:hypothetical protein
MLRARVATERPDDRYVDPNHSLATAAANEGSCWPHWVAWRTRLRPPPRRKWVHRPRVTPLADWPRSYALEA